MILREYILKFEKVPPGERAIDPDESGLRSKLGGKPDWDLEDETPVCPDCKSDMTFIAQIDSIEHDSDQNPHAIDCLSNDQQYMFGDVGLIYVFFCFECMESKSIVQCA